MFRKYELINTGSLSALLAMALVLQTASCDLVTRPPAVEWVRPANGAHAGRDTQVEVCFSESMELTSTERAFTLSCAEGAVEGAFVWERRGRLMRFTPHLPLDRGACTVTVGEDARDVEGAGPGRAFRSGFYTAAELGRPEVLEVYPADLAVGIPCTSVIRLRFSEPMDTKSVESGLKIFPAAEGVVTWNEARDTMELRPFRSLAFLTEYVIAPGAECADLSGNRLAARREYRFTAGEEFVKPVLVEATSPGSGENWARSGDYAEHHGLGTAPVLLFGFSERMDRESVARGIELLPGAQMSIVWESELSCAVSFPAGLEAGRRYELRVTDEARDAAGNPLVRGFTAYLFTDGDDAREPTVTSAKILAPGGPVPLMHMGLVEPPGTELADGAVRIELAFSAGMARASVPENTSIGFINGADPTFSGAVRRYEWSGDTLTITVGSLRRDNLYELSLRGGPDGILSLARVPRTGDIRYFFRFGE